MTIKFEDVLNEIREKQIKSDFENLANAALQVEYDIAELQQLAARIKDCAALTVRPSDAVRKLYDEAMRRKYIK